jgi:hypothetical protein
MAANCLLRQPFISARALCCLVRRGRKEVGVNRKSEAVETNHSIRGNYFTSIPIPFFRADSYIA